MKKILLLLAANVGAVAVLRAQDGFMIKGKLKGQDNHKISLVYTGSDQQTRMDSTGAENGAFELKGEGEDEPIVAYLNTKLDRNIYMTKEKKGMFIPAPSLEIVLSNKSQLRVSGTAEDINLSKVK